MKEVTQVIMANGGIEDFIREEAARYSLTVLEFQRDRVWQFIQMGMMPIMILVLCHFIPQQ